MKCNNLLFYKNCISSKQKRLAEFFNQVYKAFCVPTFLAYFVLLKFSNNKPRICVNKSWKQGFKYLAQFL